MTRNEEIEQASKQGSIEYFGYDEGDYTIPFRHGAEWADRTRIDKICKWLDDNASKYVKTEGIGIDIYKGFDSEKMIADLKKAMEKKL